MRSCRGAAGRRSFKYHEPGSSLLTPAAIDITPLVSTLHHLVATSSRRRLIAVRGDRGDVRCEVFGSDLWLV
jgi:hypothetical protein